MSTKTLHDVRLVLLRQLAADGGGMRPGEVAKELGISVPAATKLLKTTPHVAPCEVWRDREAVKGYGNFCGMRSERHVGYTVGKKWLASRLLDTVSLIGVTWSES